MWQPPCAVELELVNTNLFLTRKVIGMAVIAVVVVEETLTFLLRTMFPRYGSTPFHKQGWADEFKVCKSQYVAITH